jgi:hypothetical protein
LDLLRSTLPELKQDEKENKNKKENKRKKEPKRSKPKLSGNKRKRSSNWTSQQQKPKNKKAQNNIAQAKAISY